MQPTKNATVELLEQGQFVITYFPNGVEKKIKGRFTMVAFDRFCTLNGKEITYFQLIQKIGLGMQIGDYANLILFAIQDYFRPTFTQCPITKEDVLDIIDQIGGMSEQFFSIIKHAVGRVAGDVKVLAEEKKSQIRTQKKKK